MLKAYASYPEKSRGRLYKEENCILRNDFQRDRDRILHSAAFRRLEYKTQVFVNHEGDHYRTRLTHSLEVSQIARSISRMLGLCEDLAESLALAHDLGHPPFGHAGEDALNEVMKDFGGFDHNANTIKILTNLEHRYAQFDGLNMCWETLEGIAKHNGPLIGQYAAHTSKPVPETILAYSARHDLDLERFSSLEAQVASLADDIAYNNHDIEDGLRAGLFELEDLLSLPVIGEVFISVRALYPNIERKRLIHEAIRQIMKVMIADLVATTTSNITKFAISSVEDVRRLAMPVVSFSPHLEQANLALKKFLLDNMYRHYKINRMTSKAKRVVKDLFELFLNEPGCLPTEWRNLVARSTTEATAIVVSDFISGMTDRFAIREHELLFGFDDSKLL